ncbi:MAG: hypothetical protein ABW185_11060 [Sedimenticola sp.]
MAVASYILSTTQAHVPLDIIYKVSFICNSMAAAPLHFMLDKDFSLAKIFCNSIAAIFALQVHGIFSR